MPEAITERVMQYFERHIACFERMLDGLNTLEQRDGELDEGALTEVLGRQAEEARQLQQLEGEHQILKKEWERATHVPSDERQAVRAMAARAEALQRELAPLLESAARRGRQQQTQEEARLGDLRQGRGMMKKYGAGQDDGAAGGLDHRA